MATVDIKDAAGSTVAIEKPLAPGRAAAAASRPVALSSEDFAVIDGLETVLGTIDADTGDIALGVGATSDAAATAGSTGSLSAKLRLATSQLDAIKTAVEALDNAIIGSEMQVDVVTLPALPAGNNNIGDVDVASLPNVTPEGVEYETVAASQTGQALGATGASGDYIAGILVVPATTSPGNVILLDNAISITVFAGGASSVTSLIPFFIPLGIKSVSGAWKITTGSDVSCIGIGNFT